MAAGSVDENEIVRRIVAGEKQLYETLYEQHHRQIYLISYRICQSWVDAEDVVAEVFFRAYRSLHTYKGNSSLATWLYRITVNESYNLLKKRNRQTEWKPMLDRETDNFEEQLAVRHQVHALHDAMQTLTPQDRLILTLRYDNELSYEEIAEIVNMPKNSVGTRIARAKNALAEKMKEDS